jgi:hypothetical protein
MLSWRPSLPLACSGAMIFNQLICRHLQIPETEYAASFCKRFCFISFDNLRDNLHNGHSLSVICNQIKALNVNIFLMMDKILQYIELDTYLRGHQIYNYLPPTASFFLMHKPTGDSVVMKCKLPQSVHFLQPQNFRKINEDIGNGAGAALKMSTILYYLNSDSSHVSVRPGFSINENHPWIHRQRNDEFGPVYTDSIVIKSCIGSGSISVLRLKYTTSDGEDRPVMKWIVDACEINGDKNLERSFDCKAFL